SPAVRGESGGLTHPHPRHPTRSSRPPAWLCEHPEGNGHGRHCADRSRLEPQNMITELEFKSLASQGYNRIPLMVEAFADLETPLSLYLKLAHGKGDGKHSFLLESVVGGERFGRYSFIGLPARTLLRASGFGAEAKTEVVTDGAVVETASGNPLDFIASYQQRFKVALRPG